MKNQDGKSPMNQTQTRYLRERIQKMVDEKVKKVNEKRPDRYLDRATEIIQAEIKAGRFTMPTKAEVVGKKYDYDLHKLLKFHKYPGGYDQASEEVKKGDKAHQDRIKAIFKLRDEMIDQIMLGDSGAALASLQDFARKLERL